MSDIITPYELMRMRVDDLEHQISEMQKYLDTLANRNDTAYADGVKQGRLEAFSKIGNMALLEKEKVERGEEKYPRQQHSFSPPAT